MLLTIYRIFIIEDRCIDRSLTVARKNDLKHRATQNMTIRSEYLIVEGGEIVSPSYAAAFE